MTSTDNKSQLKKKKKRKRRRRNKNKLFAEQIQQIVQYNNNDDDNKVSSSMINLNRLMMPLRPQYASSNLIVCGQPIYYYSHKDKKGYIIDSTYERLQKYDIKNDIWSNLGNKKFPISDFCPTEFNTFCVIDTNKDRLCAIGLYRIGIFDLKSETWTVLKTPDRDNVTVTCGCSLFVNNKVYCFVSSYYKSYLMSYNIDNNKFQQISSVGIQNNSSLQVSPQSMVYIQSKMFLMIFGGFSKEYSDKIWYARSRNTANWDHKWKLFPVRLPLKGETSCIVALDNIIIMIYYDCEPLNKNIWCLDLNMGSLKKCEWIKCEDKFNDHGNQLLITPDNYIHFMDFGSKHRGHFKVHLSQLLPSKIYNKYKRYYNCLIAGYVKKAILDMYFPMELISLINKMTFSFSL